MEEALHRFVRLLRLHGLRVSVSESLDAMHAAAQPGVLADRDVLRSALAVTLVKDRRDLEVFERVFDRFFGLRTVVDADGDEHGHAHDDLSDQGELERFTLSEDPGDTPQEGHSHGKPVDLKDFFKPEDMARRYNLHQEANRLDMSSLTDEIVLSNETQATRADAARVQLSTDRLHNPGRPGDLASSPGLQLDVELSVAEEMALLDWLGDVTGDLGDEGEQLDLSELRAALAPLLAGLPQRLKEHLEKLMAMEREVEAPDVRPGGSVRVDETERNAIEESLRRLLRSLHGAPRPRRRVAARGSVDGARTMRANLRFDGVPFRPVTVARVEDRPKLLVLADVSLSVRQASRFTLHLVHSLQSLASKVRSFCFVADLVEISDLFDEHRIEDALSLVLAGLPAGGVLDVDADSDYGQAFRVFLDEYGAAITRRTTVLVLGDGRNNGKDPGIGAFEEITRRARETAWLTPEPQYSWGLGGCDLPRYAELCDRVHVVRDLGGLDRVTTTMVERTGR